MAMDQLQKFPNPLEGLISVDKKNDSDFDHPGVSPPYGENGDVRDLTVW